MSPTPPDQVARDRIRTDLGSTLFVEAGAGSGKTRALVERVVELVLTGTAELQAIAAITFTEKAGAELRVRLRQALATIVTDPDAAPGAATRCEVALGQLDAAAIGTLHSFAQRVLSRHPVEAGLPPRVEVLDEVSSGIAFDGRWTRILDQLLTDPGLERTLLLLSEAGVDPKKLRALALAFERSWDLVESRVPAVADEPPPLAEATPQILAAVHSLAALAGHCTDPADKLLGRVEQIVEFGAELDAVGDHDLDVLEHLNRAPSFAIGNIGQAKAWDGYKAQVVEQVRAVAAAVEGVRSTVLQACARQLGSVLRGHTLAAADARRQDGRLEFHDLLVLARKVLRHPVQGPIVRTSLHDQFQRLLLDEFQDTDPIQIELAVCIAASDPGGDLADAWPAVEVDPGRLFVVGDPKQSIYRFRRADIGTFMATKERFAPAKGDVVELTTNFRTVEPLIDWVNHTIGTLMGAVQQTEVERSQPKYVSLAAWRGMPEGGPAVSVLGSTAHPPKTRADAVRAAEAREVARAVTVAMADGWRVSEEVDGEQRWREARLSDIRILLPARTSLPFLEDALEAAQIPYRTESSSLVYASRAVRDLMMVLRASDDPTDHLRIVAALRTPLLACGDDDLLRHKAQSGATWSYNTPTAPDPAAGPVAEGLAYLRRIHDERHWKSPAELLDQIARDRRALELGFAEERPRDVWRRLRFVIDQARAWSDATGGTLRAYLHWVDQQTVEGARVAEAVLPEPDDEAVGIMTIHAAKGLEFPIVILSGMSTGPMNSRNHVDVVFPRDDTTVGYRLGKDVTTEEFDDWKPIDEQMGYDERVRLLYVAATRARDHLVVSLHRAERSGTAEANRRTNAELLVDGMGSLLDDMPDLSGTAEALTLEAPSPPAAPPPFTAWEDERASSLAGAARPGAVAATALTQDGVPDPAQPSPFPAEFGPAPGDADDAGLQKRPRDLDLPPWLKGRYGTSVGRAVHGVLQAVDLATGEGIDDAVAAQCQAEAVVEHAATVRDRVEAALGCALLREAAGAEHWREIYACTPIGDRLLEGYVDLLYRGPDGLVVVDYKTADSSDPNELDRRALGYRLQGAAYAVSVGRATAEEVTRVVFLFLTPHGAVERELVDLAAATAEVERLVVQGTELVTA